MGGCWISFFWLGLYVVLALYDRLIPLLIFRERTKLLPSPRAGEVDDFKKNINNVMKDLLGKFKDLQFYTGESMDPTSMILILEYKEVSPSTINH